MNNTKKLIGAATLAASLTGGGIAGALLFAPGISGAQTDTTTTAPADTEEEARVHPLDTAAEALGMTADELRTELEAGKSIATVAGERGVDVNTVIDALVADARTRITEAVNQDGGFFERGHRDGHGDRFHLREGLGAAADTLGVTEDELMTSLRDGQTIAELAAEKGVDVQTVIDAVVAQVGEEDRDAVTQFVNEGGPRFHDADDSADSSD